jgi:hydroxymethylglutaryl-CoA lyase
MNDQIKMVECPRDAMQGWPQMIPTAEKIKYVQQLLQCGFHTLDCGSFVSPKAIPQMADTADVIKALNIENTTTKLLVIAANLRGAEEAVMHENITYIGYPFSISSTFQLRNANSTIEESFERVEAIQELCIKNGKQLVVYISMGFGNPYGDEYSEEIVHNWIRKITELDINIISLADTVGVATYQQVSSLVKTIIASFPQIETGVHLHASPLDWEAKASAALEAGCRRFDGALKGFGGCPMANDELVGNMDTEKMIRYFESEGFTTGIHHQALQYASDMATKIFIDKVPDGLLNAS